MSGKHIGYVRVSTTAQNTDRQLDGVKLDKLFEEKVPGKMRAPVRFWWRAWTICANTTLSMFTASIG